MDYLQYVDKDSLLHRLDPRTKFFFFLAMAILTSLTKSGAALVFLFLFFLGIWLSCGIMSEMGKLLGQLKALLIFIFKRYSFFMILFYFKTAASRCASTPAPQQPTVRTLRRSAQTETTYSGRRRSPQPVSRAHCPST